MSSECPENFESVKTIPVGEGFYSLVCMQRKGEAGRQLVVDNGRDDGTVICSCQATAEQVQRCVLSARDIVRSPDLAERILARVRLGCAEAREDELASAMKLPWKRGV